MIKFTYFLFFICIFSLGMMACTGKKADRFKNLSSDQFEEMIQDKNIQLVDVRTVAEYSDGRITVQRSFILIQIFPALFI